MGDAAVARVAAVLLRAESGDVGAGAGEEGVFALDGVAAVVDVSAEDVGALGEGDCGGGTRGGAGGDGDGGTLHVHLAVAEVVEPGPR